MFKSLKKIFVLIPCMVLAFFVFSGVKALAGDAVLLDSSVVTVGKKESKENTYYFTTEKSWEFKAQYSALKEWDTYLKWRVIRPDGMATAWSSKDYYVDNNGKFIIKNYSSLSYTKDVGLKDKTSIAPLSTYYVEVQYYGQLITSWHQDEKDEIIKVVVAPSDILNYFNTTITKSSNTFTITSTLQKNGQGYGAITKLEYFFSATKQNISNYSDFYKAKGLASSKGELDVTPASKVTKTLTGANSKYLYVMATDGNGYCSFASYDTTASNNQQNPSTNGGTTTNPTQNNAQTNNDKDSGGLLDYDIGQLILIVLVIVLIVSCALIIAQKIVDHKKKLY